MKWFTENGGVIHKNVEFLPIEGYDDRVWGMFATGFVKPDSVIVGAPSHLLLRPLHALHSIVENIDLLRAQSTLPAEELTPRLVMEAFGFGGKRDSLNPFKDAKRYGTHSMQGGVLALYLLAHWNNQDNFYYPYIAALPKGTLK